MGDPVAISAQNLSKKYRLFNSPKERLWETLHPFNKKYHREFWALKDIDFQIPKGATVGIIGQNGSGKSTLLKIICSVLQPTSGEVTVNGRISALLELGSGFHPEFTGRENIQFSGTLMGFSQEQMKERLPQIEAFADIGEFIDQPVRIYSSGMLARLAFATAIHVNPDILVIDEILSVGDAKFQHKCFQKFHEFQQAGKTILFVSHDAGHIVRHCDSALLFANGNLIQTGEPQNVIDTYFNLVLTGETHTRGSPSPQTPTDSVGETRNPDAQSTTSPLHQFLKESSEEDRCAHHPNYNKSEYRIGNGRATLIDYLILSEGKTNPTTIVSGDTVDIYIKAQFNETVTHPIFGFALKTVEGVTINASNTRYRGIEIDTASSNEVIVYCFSLKLILHPGDYFIDLGVAEKISTKDEPLDIRNGLIHIHVTFKDQFDGWVDLEQGSKEISRTLITSKPVS